MVQLWVGMNLESFVRREIQRCLSLEMRTLTTCFSSLLITRTARWRTDTSGLMLTLVQYRHIIHGIGSTEHSQVVNKPIGILCFCQFISLTVSENIYKKYEFTLIKVADFNINKLCGRRVRPTRYAPPACNNQTSEAVAVGSACSISDQFSSSQAFPFDRLYTFSLVVSLTFWHWNWCRYCEF